MYMLICKYSFHDNLTLTKKITLLDNAMELNISNFLISNVFIYSTEIKQIENIVNIGAII